MISKFHLNCDGPPCLGISFLIPQLESSKFNVDDPESRTLCAALGGSRTVYDRNSPLHFPNTLPRGAVRRTCTTLIFVFDVDRSLLGLKGWEPRQTHSKNNCIVISRVHAAILAWQVMHHIQRCTQHTQPQRQCQQTYWTYKVLRTKNILMDRHPPQYIHHHRAFLDQFGSTCDPFKFLKDLEI